MSVTLPGIGERGKPNPSTTRSPGAERRTEDSAPDDAAGPADALEDDARIVVVRRLSAERSGVRARETVGRGTIAGSTGGVTIRNLIRRSGTVGIHVENSGCIVERNTVRRSGEVGIHAATGGHEFIRNRATGSATVPALDEMLCIL